MKHSFHKDVTRTLWPLCRLIRLAALPLAGAVIATSVRSADVTGPYFGQTPAVEKNTHAKSQFL